MKENNNTEDKLRREEITHALERKLSGKIVTRLQSALLNKYIHVYVHSTIYDLKA